MPGQKRGNHMQQGQFVSHPQPVYEALRLLLLLCKYQAKTLQRLNCRWRTSGNLIAGSERSVVSYVQVPPRLISIVRKSLINQAKIRTFCSCVMDWSMSPECSFYLLLCLSWSNSEVLYDVIRSISFACARVNIPRRPGCLCRLVPVVERFGS